MARVLTVKRRRVDENKPLEVEGSWRGGSLATSDSKLVRIEVSTGVER